MLYSLGFSPDFFLAEGEPYDRSDLCTDALGRPASVWSAIEHMRATDPDQWADLAKEVFGLQNPEFLATSAVFDKINETDTCENLDVPVIVWIDSEGDFTLVVYDNSEH